MLDIISGSKKVHRKKRINKKWQKQQKEEALANPIADENQYNAMVESRKQQITGINKQIETLNSTQEKNNQLINTATVDQNQLYNSTRKMNRGFAEYMKNNPTPTMKGYVGQLVATKAKAIAASVGVSILNAAISMGVSFILSTAISAIQSIINKDRDAIEAARELTDEFKAQNESIEETTKKINELKDAIASGTLTESEAYEKKKELLDIQNELYDAYGK